MIKNLPTDGKFSKQYADMNGIPLSELRYQRVIEARKRALREVRQTLGEIAEWGDHDLLTRAIEQLLEVVDDMVER